jgi:hypothetical protein
VINGVESPIPRRPNEHGELVGGNTFAGVYGSMLRQICLDYSSLPDVKRLKYSEIKFFYDGIRESLKGAQ